MKKILMMIIYVLFTLAISYSQSVESKVRKFARNEYPNDQKMQEYVFNEQISAYRYMRKVDDVQVKQFAQVEYPNDYSLQKYVYDNQLSAKEYMDRVTNLRIKRKAVREYPSDYSMQKYIYDMSVK